MRDGRVLRRPHTFSATNGFVRTVTSTRSATLLKTCDIRDDPSHHHRQQRPARGSAAPPATKTIIPVRTRILFLRPAENKIFREHSDRSSSGRATENLLTSSNVWSNFPVTEIHNGSLARWRHNSTDRVYKSCSLSSDFYFGQGCTER